MVTSNRRRPGRLFRVLLGLFPGEFRGDFGPEMEATFEEQQREAAARGGRRASAGVWVRTAGDILRAAPRQHLDMLRQDAGFAVRALRRNPGFALAAVTTLALGVGAVTAVFSIVNAVLLRPLPYRAATRLVLIRSTGPGTGEPWPASFTDFQDWKRDSRSFDDLAAAQLAELDLAGAGEAERVTGLRVSDGFLSLLGVTPALGRGLLASDETVAAGGAMVLSHGLWVRRFGGAPDVVGRTVTMSGLPFTVVGVLPPDFRFPFRTDVLTSLDLDPRVVERGNRAFLVLAHLRPGVTIDAARQDVAAIARRSAEAFPAENRGWGATVVGLQDTLVGPTRQPLLLLMAAVSLVLLIACANLGNLLLARASARTGEIGIRTALGASRPRLVRQLLTESLVVGLAAGAVGLALADLLVRVAGASLPATVTALIRLEIDVRVLAFALGVSVATGVVFGLAPAVRSSRVAVTLALGSGANGRAGTGGGRLRAALVASEVAMALVLLVSAGLLLRSLGNLLSVDPGIRPGSVLTVGLSLPPTRYGEPERVKRFYRDLVSSVSAAPGVEAVGVVNEIPMGGFNSQRAFVVEGRPRLSDGRHRLENVAFREADPGYFAAIGIPLRRGRLLTERDQESEVPDVLVNETMARRFWPGEDAVGKRLALATAPDAFTPWMTVAGVVGDVRHLGPRIAPQPELYVPRGGYPGRSVLVVRASVPLATLAPAVRRVVAALDPELPLRGIRPMAELLAESTAPARVTSGLLAGAGVLALALAMVGLYGVVSYAVARRRREIGLRIALGASGQDVIRMVVGRGAAFTAVGIAAGLAGAWALSRLLARQLYGVSPTDPLAFAGAAVLVGVVSLAASWAPARRATRIDPVTALRYE